MKTADLFNGRTFLAKVNGGTTAFKATPKKAISSGACTSRTPPEVGSRRHRRCRSDKSAKSAAGACSAAARGSRIHIAID